MRRSAPPGLHQLSNAAAPAAMSSRPSYRGGQYRGGQYRGRRGFSSERSNADGRGQFISGDAHFGSVRDSNLGFRDNFTNNTGFYLSPPPFSENYQFRRASMYIQRRRNWQSRPDFEFQQPPQSDRNRGVRTPQQFRPQAPRPLDYRNWEYAKPPPPANCERFTVLSYNILADYLAMDHRRKLYPHIPLYILDWQRRKKNITFELGLWSADIMCFQEVDKFHDLEEALKVRGYSGIWKMRTGNAVDGCAIFWRVSRFKLLHEEYIEFNKLGLRDNVTQICVLESQNNAENSGAPPARSSSFKKVVICNIHVLYNPKRGEIKFGQVRVLLEKANAVSKIWNNAPIVLCGDFNCTPKSALYNFLLEQKIDLSGLARDKVSGQSSAEIHAPLSPYPNPQFQPANDLIPSPLRSNTGNIDRKPDNSLSDMQKQDYQDSCVENENLLSANHSLPRDSANCALDVSGKSCNGLVLAMEGITLHSEVKKEIERGASCDHKNERETTCCSITFAKDKFPAGHTSNADLEEFHLSASEREQMQKLDTDSHINYRSSTDGFDKDDNFAKESNNSGDKIIADDNRFDLQPDLLAPKDFPSTLARQNFTTSTVADSSDMESVTLTERFDHPVAEYKKEISAERIESGPSWSLTRSDLLVDEKLEILSSDEQDGATVDGSLTEDDHTFLSALHDSRELVSDFQSSVKQHFEVEDNLLPGLNAGPFEVENTFHDRSSWTPMEIETATGNADCTIMEHPLKLRSAYAEVKGFSGTRDVNGEPLATSYNRCFLGTVDYIWHSEGLQTVRVLAPIQKHVMQSSQGFPTKKWGSDHIALVSELAFTEDVTN